MVVRHPTIINAQYTVVEHIQYIDNQSELCSLRHPKVTETTEQPTFSKKRSTQLGSIV